MNQILEQRRVDYRAELELLSGNRCTDDGKDSGADDSSDAERSERPGTKGLFKAMLGFFRVGDEFIDGFARKQLAGQCCAPDEDYPRDRDVRVQDSAVRP